ncbi:hypothetical protein BDZ91DRAFT_712607 [Kalaharituber pfeilii]|nr:hypothetical protein BDZ91DRAFT_712607 [Kalaharituber pfeilii]
MPPTITASPTTYVSHPGHLSSKTKSKKSNKTKSFASKSGGLHNVNLLKQSKIHKKQKQRLSALGDPKKLNKRDAAKIAQLEKELPKLNGVVPPQTGRMRAGGGGKKGKVFVEDKETMLSILSMVNDTKDVQIENKLEKGRQLEALRELRRKQQETREEQKKSKLDSAKSAIRKKRRSNHPNNDKSTTNYPSSSSTKAESKAPPKKKKVSFA